MVRRDAKNEPTSQGEGSPFACCACPAGESPVPVPNTSPPHIAFGATVTHPALRVAGITGQRSTLMAGSSGTIPPSLRATRDCPPPRWNSARNHDGTLPAIAWNGCPRSVEYAVELTEGREGFDFLRCHLHKRMSWRLWQTKGLRRYYLHRWPSGRAMNRIRERERQLTPRGRCHQDLRGIVAELNPVLRGWGRNFGSGNPARQFVSIDSFVVRRLRTLRVKRKGRNLLAGEAQRYTRAYFESFGLYRLRGTTRYPEPSLLDNRRTA